MRNINFIIAVILMAGFFGINDLLEADPQSPYFKKWDKDNYGKIIGQIVDADTGEPVHEVFRIFFYSGIKEHFDNDYAAFPILETDKKGYFTINYKPGHFFLYCKPDEPDSLYCEDRDPFRFPGNRAGFPVERGKITKVMKKVHKGGELTINLIDPSGSKLIPKNLFSNVNTYADLVEFDTLKDFDKFRKKGDLDNGEITLIGIFPGTYHLHLRFGGMGLVSQVKENISIESKRTTTVEIQVNLNDDTGVQGKVFDLNSNPLKGIKVTVYTTKIGTVADVYTDDSGNYKISGLNEGQYYIKYRLYYGKNNRNFISYPLEKITVYKSQLTQKNITLDTKGKTVSK